MSTLPSRSTDKLQIICESINDKILSDETLKQRVKSIKITWDNVETEPSDCIAVPSLNIEFKD